MDEVIQEQKPLSCVELKEALEGIQQQGLELGFRANRVVDYLNTILVQKKKDHDALRSALEGLGIARLRDRHIIKILDILPLDLVSLKTLLSGESITIKPEEYEKILQVIQEHVSNKK